jgi:hypothetical protein
MYLKFNFLTIGSLFCSFFSSDIIVTPKDWGRQQVNVTQDGTAQGHLFQHSQQLMHRGVSVWQEPIVQLEVHMPYHVTPDSSVPMMVRENVVRKYILL